MKHSYQVRVSYDKDFKTLKEFRFDEERAAASFFEKAVKMADRIGYGTVALFRDNVWRVKSYHIG